MHILKTQCVLSRLRHNFYSQAMAQVLGINLGVAANARIRRRIPDNPLPATAVTAIFCKSQSAGAALGINLGLLADALPQSGTSSKPSLSSLIRPHRPQGRRWASTWACWRIRGRRPAVTPSPPPPRRALHPVRRTRSRAPISGRGRRRPVLVAAAS